MAAISIATAVKSGYVLGANTHTETVLEGGDGNGGAYPDGWAEKHNGETDYKGYSFGHYAGYVADANGIKEMCKRLAWMGKPFALHGVFYSLEDNGRCLSGDMDEIEQNCWARVLNPDYNWFSNSPDRSYNNTKTCRHEACKHGKTQASMQDYWRDIYGYLGIGDSPVWLPYGCRGKVVNQVTTSPELGKVGNCGKGPWIVNGLIKYVAPCAIATSGASTMSHYGVLILTLLTLAAGTKADGSHDDKLRTEKWSVKTTNDPTRSEWDDLFSQMYYVDSDSIVGNLTACCRSKRVTFPECYLVRTVEEQQPDRFAEQYAEIVMQEGCKAHWDKVRKCLDRFQAQTRLESLLKSKGLPLGAIEELMSVWKSDGFSAMMNTYEQVYMLRYDDDTGVIKVGMETVRLQGCGPMEAVWNGPEDLGRSTLYGYSSYDSHSLTDRAQIEILEKLMQDAGMATLEVGEALQRAKRKNLGALWDFLYSPASGLKRIDFDRIVRYVTETIVEGNPADYPTFGRAERKRSSTERVRPLWTDTENLNALREKVDDDRAFYGIGFERTNGAWHFTGGKFTNYLKDSYVTFKINPFTALTGPKTGYYLSIEGFPPGAHFVSLMTHRNSRWSTAELETALTEASTVALRCMFRWILGYGDREQYNTGPASSFRKICPFRLE